ncbi:protein kinase domain-containing protein [Effusibacillus consociatus]|uniref:Protein kinase n=1 Tax=Effusibacillus consociatus TaxID=1117041 RepID=A0ABV9Q436_9BACL
MQRRMFSDRYQLEERLEASNGADLYRALDVSFPRNVFVTVFSDCDSSAVESFRARAQSLAGLSHHHIMSIYDMECQEDSCYLISEYRECLTLREALDAERRFSLEEALFMAMNMAKAIAHAHEQQVVHGHLSSEMIWIQGDDIKVAFVCPQVIPEWIPAHKQEDLLALGKLYKELFAATPPLYKPEVREKVMEVVDRLLGARHPVYTDASDVAYDLKMILTKDANPLYTNQLTNEDEHTRTYEITRAEIQSLLGAPKQSGLRKIRKMFLSYFAVSIGMLLLGAVASLFLANTKSAAPGKLQSSIEKGPISVAKAEVTETSSTITISPKEPIARVGQGGGLMPDLIGLQRHEAEKLLLSLGLRYQYFLERSDKPAGTVFKQDQPPNHPFQPGDRVIFYISNGK